MKRNSFSSFKLVAILLSMLMFTACDKNEFTAQDALDLELQRLTREREIEAEREAFEASKDAAAHTYRKVLDSLERVNAGGLVYYSVGVVPGGGSVFIGGGRTEGVSGASVTISQFGQNVSVTTDESGIASFPDLRSGEVVVNISIDGFTDMTYISNLTPDGGVANNASVYVGNIVPVFENDGANPDNISKMAVLHGRGYAELDILYGNDVEEIVPANTGIAAFIDPNNAFFARYIDDSNASEEGQDAFFGSTGSGTRKSGFIQRIVYEEAGNATTFDPNTGDYSMMVPATGSGLQTTMRYSEFTADRTYFDMQINDDDFGPVSKRFLYGPNVTPTAIPITGNFVFHGFPVPFFDFVDQEGSVDVQLTNAGAVSSVTINGNIDGLYLIPPTVTIAAPPAGGTQATVVAVLESNTTTGELREIDHFTVTAGGGGYTSAPAVTVMRRASGITGTVRQEVADGGLSATVRVIDGGFGFTSASIGGAPFTTVGQWTGLNPHFNTPSGFTGTAPGLTFTYDFMLPTAGNANFDVVSHIVAGGGSDWTQADLNVVNTTPFVYVINDAQFPQVDQDGDFLFITTGSSLAFNPSYGSGAAPAAGTIGGQGALAGGTFDLTAGVIASGLTRGSAYVFVPQINLQNVAGGTGASMVSAVDATGSLQSITLVGGSGFTLAQANAVTVTVVDPTNALDAEFFLGGSGIQAYNITNADGNAGYMTEVLDVTGGFNETPETAAARTDANAETVNTFVALAAIPIGPGGGTDAARAYGYPHWATGQKQVIGIELFSGGNGYDAAGQDFSWELVPVYGNETGMNATANSTVTSEQLSVTITNGGSGYSTTPTLSIIGGGVNLGDVNHPLTTDFSFWVDRQGTLVKVNNGYNGRVGANFPYTAAAVAADPFQFILDIEDKEFALTNEYFALLVDNTQAGINTTITHVWGNRGSTNNGQGDVFDHWSGDTKTEFENMIDNIPDMIAYSDGIGNAITKYSFAVAPTVTVIDLRGFGSGIVAEAAIDRTDGQINNLKVTNGGSGYELSIETNSDYISAEAFRVLGGPDGNVNGALEVYSGIQYLRDIHYGTGQELE